MFYYTNDKLAWLCIPKNASTSLIEVFANQLHWTRHDLYRSSPQDIQHLEFFACLRDPNQRHAMGLVQYLASNDMLDLIDHARYSVILASAILDEHSMPLHFAVPQHIIDRCRFFIMDDPGLDFQHMLTTWLAQKGTVLPAMPCLNQSVPDVAQLRRRVDDIKLRCPDHHNKLTKWALERDMILYGQQRAAAHQMANC